MKKTFLLNTVKNINNYISSPLEKELIETLLIIVWSMIWLLKPSLCQKTLAQVRNAFDCQWHYINTCTLAMWLVDEVKIVRR